MHNINEICTLNLRENAFFTRFSEYVLKTMDVVLVTIIFL